MILEQLCRTLVLIIVLIGFIHCLNVCEDWVQYTDTKCIKVVEKRLNWEDAVRECRELNDLATLITIHDTKEQLFFNNLLTKYNTISNNAWIALKFANESFQWTDGSADDFTNWSDDAVRDGKNECVQMSLDRTSLGKWIDDSCVRKALVVCQKKQIITFGVLKKAIDNLTDIITDQNSLIATQAKEMVSLKAKSVYMTDTMSRQNQVIAEQSQTVDSLRSNLSELMDKVNLMAPLDNTNSTLSGAIKSLDKAIINQANDIQFMKNTMKNYQDDVTSLKTELIPLGFVYTQLPDQAPPSLIWPKFAWTDVTKNYAGLFFRAEGGNSSGFGTVQSEQSPRLIQIHKYPGQSDLWGDVIVNLEPGVESKKLYTGGNTGNDVSLSFFVSAGEVRPVNKAVRIWKRTG